MPRRVFSDLALPGRDVSWKRFLLALKDKWLKDRGSDVAASVTFFSVLGLFPFLLFLVALAGLVVDPTAAEALIAQLRTVAPDEVVELLDDRIRALGRQSNVGLLTASAALAIWISSGAVVSLMSALNIAYEVEDSRSWLKRRLLAIGLTILAALVAVTAGFLAVALPPLLERLGGTVVEVLLWLRLPIAASLMMVLWGLLYRALPDVEQKLRFITPGSVFGVLVWALASWGFSVYVRNFGRYDATYGTLGTVVILLFWMWISSQVLMLGAEINAVLEAFSPGGKKVGAKSREDTGPDVPRSQHDVPAR